jgi:RimJ/RimL family protein N-acetyltransferase
MMSFVLEPQHYTRIHSLFEEMMACHLAVQTVLAGILPGKIYADDPTSPGSAILIPSNQHRIYASGDPDPHLLTDVLDTLFKQSRAEGYIATIHYSSNSWEPIIAQVLQKQEARSSWRQLYRLSKPSSKALPPLPEHITIGRIDKAIQADSTLINRQFLLEEICSESPSPEYFFNHNFGFCARDGQKLVAWCLAEYHYQGRYELGIETIEAYQRKGIATRVASAVINDAFARGATEIGWHCWAANTPSVATALKLGFEKVLDYPVYFYHYK